MTGSQQDGFIIVDHILEDWEIKALDLGELFSSAEAARDYILTEIHPAYWESYAVREVSNGELIPELR